MTGSTATSSNAAGADLVSLAFRDPVSVSRLDPAGWEKLLSQARHAGLIARLTYLLDDRGLLADVPDGPGSHLTSGRLIADKLANDVRWEVRCLRPILAKLGVPIVLLKGAAYVAADLPPSRGRVFSDVDFMVPQDRIREVEIALRGAGWVSKPITPYDDKYYREWSHQIPPLVHDRRGTVIDLHHTIIPETARTHIDVDTVYRRTIPVGGDETVRVLAPEDMVLHSAVHLLNEGEFGPGLRDLLDLTDLLGLFGRDPGFWPALADRAEALGLTRPLYYALAQIERLFGAGPPDALRPRIATWGPSTIVGAVMERCLSGALRPIHPTCDTAFSAFARWLLFVRGHYLRMPVRMLLPHLVRKAVMPLFGPRQQAPQQQ